MRPIPIGPIAAPIVWHTPLILAIEPKALQPERLRYQHRPEFNPLLTRDRAWAG
jgi:hypothetical protein